MIVTCGLCQSHCQRNQVREAVIFKGFICKLCDRRVERMGPPVPRRTARRYRKALVMSTLAEREKGRRTA